MKGPSPQVLHPERLARSVLDSFSAHVAVLDETGTILETNRAWREYTRTNPPAQGNTWEGANYLAVCDAVTGPEAGDAAAMAAGIRAVQRGEAQEFILEYPCPSSQGQHWFKARVNGFWKDDALRVVVAHENITALKLQEEAQRETRRELELEKARLGTLVQSIPDLIWLKSVDGVYFWCNPAVERLFGAKEEDIIGRTDYDFFDRELADFVREKDREAMASGGPCVNEEWLTFSEHDRRAFCETIKTPVCDADGQIIGVLGIARDITSRHLAEEKLKQTLAELARSNEELEQFAYVASHDLQEPLRMVASYTQLLARRYQGRLGPDADEFISYAVDGANRMQELITDLLEYSRVGTRGKKLEPSDFTAVLDQALASLKASIDESGAVVTCDPLPTLLADRVQITRVFQNLIGNAIKFRSQEPPRIHVSAEHKDKEWTFAVRDNGIGIDPRHADRIFAIFQRLHNREEYSGTGIGLAICKKMVERHGGRIWVHSAVGQGSTFYFTIPGAACDLPARPS